MVGEWPATQPVDQFVTVVRIQDSGKRPEPVCGIAYSVCNRKQMQIMVAQHHFGRAAEAANEAYGLQGLRSTIDKVPCQPQPVFVRVKFQFVEQAPERVVTALQIAYRINRHLLQP